MNIFLSMVNNESNILRPLFNNERGSLSFLGLSTFLMFFCLFFFYFFFHIEKIQQTKTHIKSLLCLKRFVTYSNNHIKRIDNLNKVIMSANAAALFPPTRPAAQVTKKTAQLAQQFSHVSYLKKAILNNTCQVQNKTQFYKHLLLKTKGIAFLKRDQPHGTAQRNLNWKLKFLIVHKRKIIDILELSIRQGKIVLSRKTNVASAFWNLSFGSL